MKTTKLRNDYTQFKNKVSDICTDTWDNYVHTEPVAQNWDKLFTHNSSCTATQKLSP